MLLSSVWQSTRDNDQQRYTHKALHSGGKWYWNSKLEQELDAHKYSSNNRATAVRIAVHNFIPEEDKGKTVIRNIATTAINFVMLSLVTNKLLQAKTAPCVQSAREIIQKIKSKRRKPVLIIAS